MFNVEKHNSVFVASHAVSRHRSCDDIAFRLDENAVPVDAAADRQLQLEMEKQNQRARLYEQISECFEDSSVALMRNDIVKLIIENTGLGKSKAYEMVNNAVTAGILYTNDKKHFFLKST